MSIYIETIQYFTSLATIDPNIRHGENGRKGFISVSDPEEVEASVVNRIDPPFVVQIDFSGGLTDSSGSVENVRYHTLQFFAKAEIDGANQPAMEAAFELAFTIMDAWKWKFLNAYYTDQCGRWKNLNVGSFRWEKVSLSDNFCGWQLSFSEQKTDTSFYNPSSYWP